MAVADTEQQLAWEARQRPRAGVAAILAGLLVLGADLWTNATFRDAPAAGFLEALGNAARPGPLGTAPSVRTPSLQFFHDHAGAIIAASALRGVGLLALGWTITFLAAATRGRRPELPRLAIHLPVAGAVLQAVAGVVGQIAYSGRISDFLAGPRTVDAATEVASGGLLIMVTIVGFLGQVMLAAGLVLVCLNAMRAGLLTRFMGILGIIVGVLQIVLSGPLPVVQSFWLIAIGAMLLGFWPGAGVPPAWRSGRAEPWPSAAEVAEQRRAAAEARGGRRGARAAPSAEPEDDADDSAAADRPGPIAAARRKRKRRR